jgi:hypothetical protein
MKREERELTPERRLTLVEGAVKRLDGQDDELVAAIAFVCEALCKINPELRAPLIRLAHEQMRVEFPEPEHGRQPQDHDRSPKYRLALREIARQLNAV